MRAKLEIVKSFATTYYPHLTLETNMLEQLAWVQGNSVNTSQANIHSKQTEVNIEVKRILSRYNSLHLLSIGDAASYRAFVQAQPNETRLSKSGFTSLSGVIKSLLPTEAMALMATCFITKSDEAIQAIPKEKRASLPNDSEQFISYVSAQCPEVFPICALLSQESIQALPYAFYRNAHARQILDMEGGYAMVSSIIEGICNKRMNYSQYRLWFARWIINIAGLDGHLETKGSSYLTEPVAQCILALQLELEALWNNPNHPVIDNYLAFRAGQLKTESSYIAYLAALMRKYDPHTAVQIQAWFNRLSPEQQEARLLAFKRQLDHTKLTPTYKPTVLDALLSMGCSVSDTLTLFIDIESQALKAYYAAKTRGIVADETPLSFRNLAFKENLVLMKDHYHRYKQLPEFEVDSSGTVLLKAPALQEEKTATAPGLKYLNNKSNGQIHKFLQQENCFKDNALKKLSFRTAHDCGQEKYKFFAETMLMNKEATVKEINEKFEQGWRIKMGQP